MAKRSSSPTHHFEQAHATPLSAGLSRIEVTNHKCHSSKFSPAPPCEWTSGTEFEAYFSAGARIKCEPRRVSIQGPRFRT
jgi:hypothetical protein